MCGFCLQPLLSLVDQLPTVSSPEDLHHLPALIYSNDRNPQDWHYTDPDGKTGVLRVRPKMSANNGDVLRELAIAGHGMVNLPLFLHYEAVNRGLLSHCLLIILGQILTFLQCIQKPPFYPKERVLLLISWHRCMELIPIGTN